MRSQNRRKYTEEFKREAVKLVEEQGRTATEVACGSGVHRSRIERWRKRFGSAGAATGERAASGAEREELKRLKAEVKQLRMELTTYQFLATSQKGGNGRSFCRHRFRRRSPRVNQDTALR